MPAVKGGDRYTIFQAWAVDDTRMSLSGLRMLALLGTYSNAQGWCWPSQDELALRLGGVTQQFISKTLHELELLGYVAIGYDMLPGAGARKRAKYKLLMDNPIPDDYNRVVLFERELAAQQRTTDQLYAAQLNGRDEQPLGCAGDNYEPHNRDAPELVVNYRAGTSASKVVNVNSTSLRGTSSTGSGATTAVATTALPRKPNVNSVPTPSPRRCAGNPLTGPSFDGKTATQWRDAYVEACYTSRGKRAAEMNRGEYATLNQVRLRYPVEVVVAFWRELKLRPYWQEKHLSLHIIAKDIGEWAGLDDAMRAWEQRRDRDGLTLIVGGKDGRTDERGRSGGGAARGTGPQGGELASAGAGTPEFAAAVAQFNAMQSAYSARLRDMRGGQVRAGGDG